jgi:hypothetical protein
MIDYQESEQVTSDRRSLAQRRLRARQDTFYRTRREWIIAEAILGVVSCATAVTGISGGIVDAVLSRTSCNSPWFFCFYSSGAMLILLAFIESRCRTRNCGRAVLRRYAHLRFYALAINFFSWSIAFAWLHFSGLNVASVYYQAIPLAVFAFAGMVEHVKALWLRPEQAGTTSMVVAGYRFLRGQQ